MTVDRTVLVTIAGLASIVGSAGVLVYVDPSPLEPGEGLPLALTVATTALLLAVVAVWRGRRGSARETAATPWSPAGRIVRSAPEDTATVPRLAGERLASATLEAEERARQAHAVEAGLGVARPHLRKALSTVLATEYDSPAAIDLAMERGAWTDDQMAAAVVSTRIPPPDRALRERIRAYLWPETVVRERIAHAVAAIEATASKRLPPVVGADTPRSVPGTPPPIAERYRDVLGGLRRHPEGAGVPGPDGPRSPNDTPGASGHAPEGSDQ